jgi:hypothetical protein
MGHVTAALFFAAVALLWTFPLARNITTHLTGISVGDNAISVWNFWWMRTALETSADFFRTDRLLAPYGTDLTLHTHTALAAFAGATALRSLSEAAATNVTLLVSLFLNGFCAYLLAMRACRDSIAALVGGLVFAGSPFIAAHLLGHYNLTTAWTIPLFAIAAAEALRGSVRWAIAAGAVLGATAYIDYYYVIYEIALLPCLAAGSRAWAIGARPPTARARSARRVVLTLLVIDAAVIVAIAVTGERSSHRLREAGSRVLEDCLIAASHGQRIPVRVHDFHLGGRRGRR